FVSPAAEFGAYAPGEKLGHYRTSHEAALFDADGKSAIGGADFGAAVVDEIEKPTLQRGQISFAY
ncbi:NAD(P)-dependent oxidoreductase, partial [Paraburkholderia sp. SIMBA_055]